MNVELKVAILKAFGSQIVASRRLKIAECKLSHLVHGHDEPNERERKILAGALGHDYFAAEEQPPKHRGPLDILFEERGIVSVEPVKKSGED